MGLRRRVFGILRTAFILFQQSSHYFIFACFWRIWRKTGGPFSNLRIFSAHLLLESLLRTWKCPMRWFCKFSLLKGRGLRACETGTFLSKKFLSSYWLPMTDLLNRFWRGAAQIQARGQGVHFWRCNKVSVEWLQRYCLIIMFREELPKWGPNRLKSTHFLVFSQSIRCHRQYRSLYHGKYSHTNSFSMVLICFTVK